LVCVFDCETIPDIELIKQNYEITKDNEIDICEEVFEIQKEKTGSTFLPIPFHKVVSISAVIANEYGNFVKVGTFNKFDTEKGIIEEFFKFIDKSKPRLVSFNGRNFDLPMLMVRALKYNLSIPSYFDNSNKWENYRVRYSENFHTDLIEVLGNYGAVRGLKLDVLAQMAGLPGKFDVHGDEVYKLYFEGELQKIEEYCESDVLNTYWLWLKYELLKGKILIKSDYYNCIQTMSDKLKDEKNYTNIFREFIKKEIENA
jgi:predicted PolB exonuclease-like 3'-5' exonuclease